MENKRTKEALKKLRDAFEADYAILILSQDRFDKVFTSADDNKQEFVGYVGNLRYTAESTDAKKLNSFMDELISIKDSRKSEDVKLNISNVSWKISDELQNKSYDELRLESITWLESYSKTLSTFVAALFNNSL